MDWITQARLDAGKAHKPTPAHKPTRSKALGLPDSEAIRLPAASGKRVLVTPAWQGSKHTAQPCVSYSLSDPTPRLFTRSRNSTPRDRQATEAVVPEVVRKGLVNNIGQDYS